MKWISTFIGASLLLIGCGGNGTGTGDGVVNVFAGTWTGPWSAGPDTGTATFHITGVNSVAGTITDSTTGQVYQVSGSLSTPNLTTTDIRLTESNNGNTVVFAGTISEHSNFSSFSGTLTDVAADGTTQTITLSFMGT